MIKIVYNKPESTRLDLFLAIELDTSRAKTSKMITDKMVLVNTKPVKKSYVLQNNDIIEYELPEAKITTIEAEDIFIKVVYEDEYLAIVDKPVGMVVHPAAGNPNGTLLNAIMHRFAGCLSSHDPERPGLVHRLDKDTSGLIIIAKDDNTHLKLTKMFAERTINKTYTAIVCGKPNPIQGTINAPIGRARSDRKKMAVLPNGRPSITHYKVTGFFDFFSVVQIKLETGRTHQIRVHFSHINNPVLGDETYNSLKRTNQYVPVNFGKKIAQLLAKKLKRQALHASKLEFIHPITNKKIVASSKLPTDFKLAVQWLKQHFYTR